MITLVSSDARERGALSALCEARDWNVVACDSVRNFHRSLYGLAPRVVVTRHKLADGYSDDVLSALQAIPLTASKIVVLASAGIAATEEARQLALGADCVLRDPVRVEVLMEYISKFTASSGPARSIRPPRLRPLSIAGAVLDLVHQRLQRGRRGAQLTPREVTLARLLIASRGDLITYEELYAEVLGRRFRGDTSNMRVLLGKLCVSARSIGIPLRDWIQVLPKTGYRYASPRP
jgi:DNA-binding response OmpR family regulator